MEEFLSSTPVGMTEVIFNEDQFEFLFNLSRASYIVYSDTVDSADGCALALIADGLHEALRSASRSIDMMTQFNLYQFLTDYYRQSLAVFRKNLIDNFQDVQSALRCMIPYRA